MREMEKKEFIGLTLLSSAVVAGGAYLGHRYYEKNRPHWLLNRLKKELSQYGTIENSWINCTPVTTKDFGEVHTGYHGGIALKEENQPLTYYEFFIDKKTGELIEFTTK
ncbi:hypothetical protein [Catellicoccus marimammalium]|uniref:PepSY domain-containing protein n=1 Tax=Catellicoccus marimammalium M35/04/3 TaxID=1234409 RepID=K8ZMU2_9ENTE|nr:hypothetical protein [Catellicoccus marimammalium]EKU27868.1 hypothetical protein C683_0127 [Catellicoccus marimammalium M35/04/3]